MADLNGSIQLQSTNGALVILPDVTLKTASSTSSIGLFVGETVVPTTSLQLPAANWKVLPSDALGTRIFVAGNVPSATGQNTLQSISPSSSIYIVDDGAPSEMTFGGSDKIITGTVPIGFSEQISCGSGRICNMVIKGKQFYYSHAPSASIDMGSKSILFSEGEVLVSFSSSGRVILPDGWELLAGPGAVVYISSYAGRTVVRNVLERNANAVCLINTSKGNEIKIGPCSQFSSVRVASNENFEETIPQRHCVAIDSEPTVCNLSEYSLPYFLTTNSIIKGLRQEKNSSQTRELWNRMVHFCAAYNVIKASDPTSYRFPETAQKYFL